eukprot:gene14549-17194_t
MSFRKALPVLSSCWLAIIFHSRTFSNTMESLVVATLLTLIILYEMPKKTHRPVPQVAWKDFLIGGIISYGIFARFTFIFFALPIGIFFLHQIAKKMPLLNLVLKAINIISGFVMTTLLLVIIDSIYFGYIVVPSDPLELLESITSFYDFEQPSSLSIKNLTFTPINSFMYNMDPKNLELHGIHNRLTHLVANFPMMFGPLIVVLFVEVISLFKIRILLVGVCLNGLLFLSLAPHQEARFLLPIFFPLIMLSFRFFYLPSVPSKTLALSWIVFNMFMTIFLGFLHQGGVVPSLIHLQHRIAHQTPASVDSINIVYYKTYMPPQHLLALNASSTYPKVQVIDLGGQDLQMLTKQVEKIHNSDTLIISPLKEILYQTYKGKTCQLIKSFWPHLSMEDPAGSLDDLRLYMFLCHDI